MERIKRSETIGYKIRLLHNQLHKNMEAKRMENEDNLTGMQRWTLGFLKDHSDCEVYQKDIEEAFSISRATASNMLGVMERKGLIKRVAVSHDARLKRLVLTDKAAALLDGAERDIRPDGGAFGGGCGAPEALPGSDATKSGCDNNGRHKMLL